jgi:Zn-dependent protease
LFNVGLALGIANLLLAAFNLLPIPPLDGSAVIERFVPNKHLGTYYHYRARALPLVLLFVILSEYVFHFGSNALGSLENWWIGLIK